ncbi:hypothetical protein [Nocardia gipuzkoensis]|uniref:hypothetical protein n=1 Tax=Nocardia gipuzkoensis TaxID=2749991 RepID=UPI002456680B|nr:hypothetical protein [Nocardia gipuzkoensis]
MTTDTNDARARAVAIATGPPLSDEPGLGPLTLPGFLREVTERYGGREALVAHTDTGVIPWTYAELWERATEVARAPRAGGGGEGTPGGGGLKDRPGVV